jgi:hypothetical protein
MEKIFSLNPRTFVVFRTLLGLFLIFYLLQRLMDLSFHYTDQGVISVLQVQKLLETSTPSLHLLSGNFYFQLFLFLTQVLLAVLILCGKFVRISIIFSWFFMNSLFFRNPFLNDAGDNILLLTLFWLMFFPKELLETKFLLKEPLRQSYSSPFIAGLMLQIFCIYFFSGILKIQNGWLTGESGIKYALLTQSHPWISQLTQTFPDWVFLGINGMTIALELLGPLLILIPISPQLRHIWIPVCFISFHLLIGLILGIWRFALTCMLLWVLFFAGKDMSFSLLSFPKSFLGKIKTTVFSFFLGLLLITNLHASGLIPHQFMQLFNPILFPLQLHQNWNMFTNSLLKVSREWRFLGLEKSGEEVDITLNHLPKLKDSQRWVNYLSQLNYNGSNEHLTSLAKSLCEVGDFKSIKLIRDEKMHDQKNSPPTSNQSLTQTECP